MNAGLLSPPLDESNARILSEKYISQIPPYPGGFNGRGIVIAGGGVRYFTNAWVAINMLRHLRCQLPIELWYLGRREMDVRMQNLIKPLDVSCVDACEVRLRHPARILNGWELKPYAIIHSVFREVLYLDADNVPVCDPAMFFDTPEYAETGAIFWPDYNRLEEDREIWALCGTPFVDEPEIESGQIVVDKQTCWRPLCLAMWYNEQSDFFYRHIHGDKETFHMAFRKLEQAYSMPSTPIHSLRGTMCQHDFLGQRAFQHRNLAKWALHDPNIRIPDFWLEDECLDFLQILKDDWDGILVHGDTMAASPREQNAKLELLNTVYEYVRVGHDSRRMTFATGGVIGDGAADCELYWELRPTGAQFELGILGQNERTCNLYRDAAGNWRGQWLHSERMSIELNIVSGVRV